MDTPLPTTAGAGSTTAGMTEIGWVPPDNLEDCDEISFGIDAVSLVPDSLIKFGSDHFSL